LEKRNCAEGETPPSSVGGAERTLPAQRGGGNQSANPNKAALGEENGAGTLSHGFDDKERRDWEVEVWIEKKNP